MSEAQPRVTFSLLGQLGRLGNQFFQVAAAVGIARKNRFALSLPPWPAAGFLAPSDLSFSDGPPAPTAWVEPSFCWSDVALSGDTDLRGYFQSERYFSGNEDEIRHLFRPSTAVAGRIEDRYGKRARASSTCSLHVRRGDYVSLPQFADLWSDGYYDRAMKCFPGSTEFLVFSDDVPWCRKRLRGNRFVFVEGQEPAEDLFLMSLCAGHIIANSSFSWWGAWLDGRQEKKVVAPARWFAGPLADRAHPFRPAHYDAAGRVRRWPWGFHDTSDLIPGSWRQV